MPATLHAADLVCPLASPPVVAGGLLVADGRVAAVGEAARLVDRAARTVRHRGVLLPGLVDAGTRVEHADVRRLTAAGAAGADPPSEWAAERWSRSAHRGAHELLRAGVTLACDVVARGAGVPALARAGIAGDSLLEIRDVRDADAAAVLEALARSLALPARGRRVGVAVDAERVGDAVLAGVGALAGRRGVPLQVDVGAAPLVRLERSGVLRRGARLARLDALDAADAARLAACGAVVVLAPAEAGPDPALAVLAGAEVPAVVAGGADPLAAAGAWLAAARRAGLTTWPSPDGARPLAEAALRLVADDAARRLGHARHGALAPGRPADFCVVDAAAEPAAPYEGVLAAGPGRTVLTVIGGVRRARRTSASEPWPALSDHRYEEA